LVWRYMTAEQVTGAVLSMGLGLLILLGLAGVVVATALWGWVGLGVSLLSPVFVLAMRDAYKDDARHRARLAEEKATASLTDQWDQQHEITCPALVQLSLWKVSVRL